MNISGLDKIKEDVQRLKERSAMYTIFTIPNIYPIEYQILKSGGRNFKGELIINYQEDELREIFDNCCTTFKNNEPCFIIYDFVFYDRGLWRDTFCLISFIPDILNIKTKVVYSTNALNLVDCLGIPLHISFNKISEITYDAVKSRCSKFRTK